MQKVAQILVNTLCNDVRACTETHEHSHASERAHVAVQEVAWILVKPSCQSLCEGVCLGVTISIETHKCLCPCEQMNTWVFMQEVAQMLVNTLYKSYTNESILV